jgi:prolyl oligopeptidase
VALPDPPAERVDVVDVLHGREVPDPYRWLEDVDDPRTVAWRQAQDALCREVLDALPGRDRLAARLGELLRTGAVGVPAVRAGTAFWTRRDADQEHGVLRCRTAEGQERVLLDPAALDPSGLTTLDAWSPSKEGRRVAVQVSTGGDEESRLSVLDVATGEVLDGPVDRCRYSPVAWVPGGEEIYYVRRLPPDAVPEGEEQFHRRVWRHRVGTPAENDELVWGEGLDPTSYYGCSVSPDGRWLLLTASAGTAPREDVWLLDRTAGGAPAQVQVGVDAHCAPWVDRAGRLWLLTDQDAPRGRLCVADPERPQEWTTVLREDEEAVLEDVVLADGDDGPVLVVLRTRHAVSEVALHDLSGRHPADVALPGVGSMSGLSCAREGGPDAWLGWTSATVPPQVLHLDVRTRTLSTRAEAPGRPDVDVQAQLLETTSADGTTVRMQVLSAQLRPDRPRPTVLYGYGGFGVALTPAYTASALAWVEARGTWVVANLRGGSEEGEAWHRAGMRAAKQNVFDDYAACADALVAAGWTTPQQLALYGGSNGGLLVGAALTQRPQSCAAVVCSAPLLDMVRYERFGLGRTWNDEDGTAEDPEELGWLLSYSPYHAVREGTRYRAVLFTVFDGDSRVDPLHARKTCAALQAATTGAGPVLLRDERGVGHGARSVSRSTALGVDVLAFLARHTGLEL